MACDCIDAIMAGEPPLLLVFTGKADAICVDFGESEQLQRVKESLFVRFGVDIPIVCIEHGEKLEAIHKTPDGVFGHCPDCGCWVVPDGEFLKCTRCEFKIKDFKIRESINLDPGWLPYPENKPQGGQYLVIDSSGDIRVAEYLRYDIYGKYEWWSTETEGARFAITHYRSLPEKEKPKRKRKPRKKASDKDE